MLDSLLWILDLGLRADEGLRVPGSVFFVAFSVLDPATVDSGSPADAVRAVCVFYFPASPPSRLSDIFKLTGRQSHAEGPLSF